MNLIHSTKEKDLSCSPREYLFSVIISAQLLYDTATSKFRIPVLDTFLIKIDVMN